MNFSKIMTAGLLAFFIISAFTNQSRAQNFEGVIHYEFPGGQSQMGEMAYMIQGSKVRMELGDGAQSAAMVYFTDKSEMLVIIHEMKGYMKTDMPTAGASADNQQSNWDKTDMKQTGETKTVAGHPCEIWEVTNDDESTYTLCMAKGLGSFVSPGNPMSPQSAPAWARKLMKDGFMPLEVVETTGGNEKLQMRATKIEQKLLDASLFKIPDGYRDMSAMMKQMQGNQ